MKIRIMSEAGEMTQSLNLYWSSKEPEFSSHHIQRAAHGPVTSDQGASWAPTHTGYTYIYTHKIK